MTSEIHLIPPRGGRGNACRWYARLGVVMGLTLLLSWPAMAQDDVVLDWNAIALKTTAGNPFTQARFMAITQLAVFEAVNAITGEYEPYLGTVTAPAGASADAAAIAAAYRVLKTYFSTDTTLDTLRTDALAVLPDGQAKDDGIAVGEAAASAMIAARVGDGALAPPAGIEPAGPADAGVWQRTPSCPPAGGVFAMWANVKPFGIRSTADFLLPPPPALTSNRYAADFNEVKKMGRLTSMDRPLDRTDVANVYATASPSAVFNTFAAQLSLARGDSLSQNARNLALINMAITDALVASFMNKYHYDFWRPETAIAAADQDGNDKTEPDSSYLPFIATPCFPSYPSNHASGSNSGAEMVRRLYGAGGHSLTFANPAVPGVVLHYTELKQITNDVDDARVCGGIHFRFDQEEGGRLGRAVATSVYKNTLRPVNP
jgi:hypothetical protein